MMLMLELLSDGKVWEKYLEYKMSLKRPKDELNYLQEFIENRDYLPVCRMIEKGEEFPLPEKAVINKTSSKKSRVVYMYPKRETTVLKLLTYLLLRKYDGLFSPGLYSFRPGRTAKDAVRRLPGIGGRGNMFSYKADISNYFNSINVDMLVGQLETVLADDPELLAFLCRLLTEKHITDRGKIITEEKGIMAGTPLSAFYANLFLRELDEYFYDKRIPYARYSDDIIVFGKTYEETEGYARFIRSFLAQRGLEMNPDKECFSDPRQGWVFLGFSCCDGIVDIAPVTVVKIKKKMRRKARSLLRWRIRSGVDGEKAASAFIRIFNRKLFDGGGDNELTWSCWYFSMINTPRSLQAIDRYAQDCIRYIISGKRTKARFNVRYDDMKRLGYRSLVHEFYLPQENDGLQRDNTKDPDRTELSGNNNLE